MKSVLPVLSATQMKTTREKITFIFIRNVQDRLQHQCTEAVSRGSGQMIHETTASSYLIEISHYNIRHSHVNFHCPQVFIDWIAIQKKTLTGALYTKMMLEACSTKCPIQLNMQGKPGGRWKSLQKSIESVFGR